MRCSNKGITFSTISLCLLLPACSMTSPETTPQLSQAVLAPAQAEFIINPILLADELVNDNPASPVNTDLTQILALSDAQQTAFLAFYQQRTDLPPHLRLSRYLERLTDSYNYQERTLSASEAFDGRAGNCISLVMLTTALANLVDLEIDYQRLSTTPVFDRQNGVILTSDHVRTRVYAPPSSQFTLRPGHVIIDYFPSRSSRHSEQVDSDTLTSMYFVNLAAEKLVADDLIMATGYARRALDFSPQHSGAMNILALLHARINDLAQAERWYQMALQSSPDDINVLNNYAMLLARQGRYPEARAIEIQIAELGDANPYQLIALAQQAYQQHEFHRALRYYDSAIDIAPYIHEAYLQKAVVLERLGRGGHAHRTLLAGQRQASLAATDDNFSRRVKAVKVNYRSAFD